MTQPSAVTATKPGLVTESITKTTFTETTVKRVTSTAVVEQVALRRSGGPLGLSIIGGNDHSCVPFGTGEQVIIRLQATGTDIPSVSLCLLSKTLAERFACGQTLPYFVFI